MGTKSFIFDLRIASPTTPSPNRFRLHREMIGCTGHRIDSSSGVQPVYMRALLRRPKFVGSSPKLNALAEGLYSYRE